MTGFRSLVAPAVLGLAVLLLWEAACRLIPISPVLLPPPSLIGGKLASEVPLLALDFGKTVIEAVIPGWIIGCVSGLAP
jgi:NitT/TauT family transport system permease protein